MEQETILTPVQKEFSKYPIDAAAFRMHGYFPEGGNDIDDIMKIEPQILHSMIQIDEQEKIIEFSYIVIKPLGFGAGMGDVQSIRTGQVKGAQSNKGHIVNAAILYILESGLMKVVSTSGALLLEKNVGFDINQDLAGDDELSSVASSSNVEDMYISLLTKKGKILKYSIKLERKVEDEDLLGNQTESNSTMK